MLQEPSKPDRLRIPAVVTSELPSRNHHRTQAMRKDHTQSLSNDGLPTTRRDFGGEFRVILAVDELGLEIDVGSWCCSEGNLTGSYNV